MDEGPQSGEIWFYNNWSLYQNCNGCECNSYLGTVEIYDVEDKKIIKREEFYKGMHIRHLPTNRTLVLRFRNIQCLGQTTPYTNPPSPCIRNMAIQDETVYMPSDRGVGVSPNVFCL